MRSPSLVMASNNAVCIGKFVYLLGRDREGIFDCADLQPVPFLFTWTWGTHLEESTWGALVRITTQGDTRPAKSQRRGLCAVGSAT